MSLGLVKVTQLMVWLESETVEISTVDVADITVKIGADGTPVAVKDGDSAERCGTLHAPLGRSEIEHRMEEDATTAEGNKVDPVDGVGAGTTKMAKTSKCETPGVAETEGARVTERHVADSTKLARTVVRVEMGEDGSAEFVGATESSDPGVAALKESESEHHDDEMLRLECTPLGRGEIETKVCEDAKDSDLAEIDAAIDTTEIEKADAARNEAGPEG